MQYSKVCVAGTFDHIHVGHEALLRRAFEVGERVLIGITSDEYVSSYKLPRLPKSPKLPISSYDQRKHTVLQWLESHSYLSRATIVPIDDPFEPAASDPRLDALVVSEETKDRGEELNALRKSRDLMPLTLIVIPMVPANGKLVMPESLRSELAKPLGVVRSSLARATGGARLIITVGDVTTKTFLDSGIVPQLMIIDHKVNRKPFAPFTLPSLTRVRVVSGPGYISQSAIDAVKSDARIIEVEGEEDLLVLPVIIEAPIGAVVYYGQPGKGLVEVVVTKQTKKKAIELLKQFV